MRILALFDFDGTITNKDSLSDFFRFVQPNKVKRFAIKYIKTLPQIVLYKLNLLSTDQFKKARIRSFFKELTYEELKSFGKAYADTVLPSIIKKSASKTINNHLANGDDVYIVSASLDIILKFWCEQYNLGMITNVIDPASKCYIGLDCNGFEKVNKIIQKIELSQYDIIYAYGDTNGDMPMLDLAHIKFYQHFT